MLKAQHAGERVHASEALRKYVVSLLHRTREDERVELGRAQRRADAVRAAKARALLEGRDHALPDDVQALAEAVLSHRIVLCARSGRDDRRAGDRDALAATPAL